MAFKHFAETRIGLLQEADASPAHHRRRMIAYFIRSRSGLHRRYVGHGRDKVQEPHGEMSYAWSAPDEDADQRCLF
jgi:hypothetical protein